MATFDDVPDEILMEVFSQLGDSDRVVLSRVNRRTYALAKGGAWLDARLCPHVSDFVNTIARLRWARVHGCPWDERTCEYAAEGGHLEVLKWAREHHCPWDEQCCAGAAASGHLDVLQWARQQQPPCPWNVMTCADAAAGAIH
jgi:hypothetical protein